MYIPSSFNVEDESEQIKLIRENPLGIIFNCGKGSSGNSSFWNPLKGTRASPSFSDLHATHVPFVFEENESGKHKIKTHLAAKNHHVEILEESPQCLVVFQGPHSYISPSWYPLKKKTHKFVPTWNYSAVHVYGTAHVVKNKEALLEFLEQVTDQEEGKRPEGEAYEEKWKLSDAPAAYIDAKLKSIVLLEIEIDHMEGNFKYSQGDPKQNVEGIIENLETEVSGENGRKVASLIREHYPQQL
ncbi:LAMI_0A08702g1_1 [Lachancea mirantina]|uniref:LAMI_0A08702g1_1 n=1 Tax=Lachancea mirantina TaxID=1230905 RepID=A0A1G4IRL1_9SACH|nr:LAMI_0A08702g1_1 [Lachancea mirantina]